MGFCMSCGTRTDPEWNICPMCGTDIAFAGYIDSPTSPGEKPSKVVRHIGTILLLVALVLGYPIISIAAISAESAGDGNGQANLGMFALGAFLCSLAPLGFVLEFVYLSRVMEWKKKNDKKTGGAYLNYIFSGIFFIFALLMLILVIGDIASEIW